MIHPIKSFRCKDYGLFMDLESGDTLAVNTASGDVLLNHAGITTFIPPAECKGFELRKQSVHRHQVAIRHMDKARQVVGYTENPSQAKSWIENANHVIARHHFPASATPRATSKPVAASKAASRAKARAAAKPERTVQKTRSQVN